jgi:plastocyanin
MWKTAALLAVASTALAWQASPAGAEHAPRTAVVRLVDVDIKPAVVTVRPGDTVEWRFLDGQYVPHDVRSTGRPRFRGSTTKASGTHRVRFTRKGTYRYLCTLHPGMRGSVRVR